MQAVVLAGGLGTRLRPLTYAVPKAMVPVRGKPFLAYELELLKRHGISNFVLCVGYKQEEIIRYFGDGEELGFRIRYSFDGPGPLGPAGALAKAGPMLGDSFFVTYGDAYLQMDYERLMKKLLASEKLGIMAVLKNEGKWGRSDLQVEGGMVIRYDKKGRGQRMKWINFGVSALRKKALDLIPGGRACDEEEFYGSLIRRGELLSFSVRNRFYGVGDGAALREFEAMVG